MTTVAWQFKPKGGSWGPPTHNRGVAMQLMQDKSLKMRELVVKEDYEDELVTKVIEDKDNKLTNLFSKVFEDISKMSKEDFRAKMELVKGSDLYIDIGSDVCPSCNNPWEEHEIGVPIPYCP